MANDPSTAVVADDERLMREHMLEYAKYVERRHPELMDEVVDWR